MKGREGRDRLTLSPLLLPTTFFPKGKGEHDPSRPYLVFMPRNAGVRVVFGRLTGRQVAFDRPSTSLRPAYRHGSSLDPGPKIGPMLQFNGEDLINAELFKRAMFFVVLVTV